MFDFDSLIFDRTAADVAAKNAKGTYNYTDLNRVGEAVAYLTPIFREFGFLADTAPKTDWAENDIPRRGEMERYIADIRRLNVIRYASELLPLPESPVGLTYGEANNIERFLREVHAAFDRIRQGWYYSNDIFSGEV